MDAAAVSELINTLGFPAAVCIALFWLNQNTVKHYEKVLLEFKTSIDNNTAAMHELRNKNNV